MAEILSAYSFVLKGIPVEVEYRKVKVMRLSVHPPEGRVKIAAPAAMSKDDVLKFAALKFEWIQKHRQRFISKTLNANNSTGAKSGLDTSLRNNSTVYVWGQPLKLQIIEQEGNSKAAVSGEHMVLRIRPPVTKAQKMKILDRFYRRELKLKAESVIKKWEGKIGVEVKKLYIRKMKTCWGSCNYTKQTLRLNSELAKRNLQCLEYVVVHEMLHIIERYHNEKFYRLLSAHIPEWKVIRKSMNTNT